MRTQISQAVVWSAVLMGARQVDAQCLRFSVDLIQPQSCGGLFYPTISASGIAESGMLCGGGGTCGKTQSAHFIWDGGQPIYLQMPPSFPGGAPTDVNSAGVVVGVMDSGGGGGTWRAYIHLNGAADDLGWPDGGNYSQAHGVTESNTVCGRWGNNWTGQPALSAFVWTNGAFVIPELPMGPNSDAVDIAIDGTICGWMGDYLDNSHAYLWKDGVTKDIGIIPGGQSAFALGISNNHNVCGGGVMPPDGLPQQPVHAFIWSRGTMVDLGTLPNYRQSRALDVNDALTAVGNCNDTPTNITRAFFWQNGVMYALQELVPPEYNLQIINATAINNAGQIAAYGHYQNPKGVGNIYVAMRLNPIPPLTGDLNCDWQVNVPDLLGVISAWGPCPPPPPGEPFTKNCHADFNDDGVVNHHDILAVVLNWSS